MKLVTFTNLFPSSHRPTHGLFVRERMARVAEALGPEWSWRVIVPVPRVPRPLRWRAEDRRFAELPRREQVELPAASGDGAATVEVEHVPYLHVPGLSARAQASRIEAACTEPVRAAFAGEPGVLDAHYLWPDAVAALGIARAVGVPCFATARGSDVNVLGRQPHVAARYREALPQAAGLFAVSEALRRRVVELAGVADEAVTMVRNGVDLERFRPGDENEARTALGLPIGEPLVLGVGRLTADKGFLTLLRAIQRMPASVRLVAIGEGPLRAELEQALPPERLHLLGSRSPDEVATAMRACDLLAFPSVREGWPNVVTEALASGLPVVATPVGAVPQMLSSPYVGALVRIDDAEALARECVRFLQRPADRARVRAHAEQFGWDEPVRALADRFRSAAAEVGR